MTLTVFLEPYGRVLTPTEDRAEAPRQKWPYVRLEVPLVIEEQNAFIYLRRWPGQFAETLPLPEFLLMWR